MIEKEIETGTLYKKELTRVIKNQVGKKNKIVRKIASPNKIFLLVTCREPSKRGLITYTKSFEILIGTPEERIDEMAEMLYQELKKQFSLS